MSNTNPVVAIHDEVSIIDFLVDNNAMIKDFNRSQFICIFIEEDFHIVLFLAESSKTHFEKYAIERFAENMNDMIALWNRFDQQIQQGHETRILKLAKNKVHDLIAMSETFRALFNRMDFDEE
jgi:hypothetical protein